MTKIRQFPVVILTSNLSKIKGIFSRESNQIKYFKTHCTFPKFFSHLSCSLQFFTWVCADDVLPHENIPGKKQENRGWGQGISSGIKGIGNFRLYLKKKNKLLRFPYPGRPQLSQGCISTRKRQFTFNH